MRYIILCPDCGNSDLEMSKSTSGKFECGKCKTKFSLRGEFGFNDEESQNQRDKAQLIKSLIANKPN